MCESGVWKKGDEKILKELERLTEIFKDMPEDRYNVCQRLIENAAFMAEQLTKLQEQIEIEGCVETYQNGQNQWGKKKSAAVDVYNTMIKNYLSVIKQLCEYLPDDSKKEADELMNFIRR